MKTMMQWLNAIVLPILATVVITYAVWQVVEINAISAPEAVAGGSCCNLPEDCPSWMECVSPCCQPDCMYRYQCVG